MSAVLIDLSRSAIPAFAAIEHASIIGVIVFVLAWLICRAIPKLPASMKCWIWRIAFLKLLLSLATNVVVPLPVLRAIPMAPTQSTAESISETPVPDILPDPTIEQHTTPSHIEFATRRTSEPRTSIELVIMSIWSAGVIASIIWVVLRWITTRRQRGNCRPVSDRSAVEIYQQVADRMCMRCPPLLQSSDVASPMLLGALRPVIVVPSSMIDSGAPSLRMIFAHELAHCSRHDTRWAAVSIISRIVFWFHPLVVWAQREMDSWREIACDDAAIAGAESAVPDYARMLLNFVSAKAQRIPLLAVGVVRSRSTLHRRLVAMQHFNSWSNGQRNAVAAVVATVGLCAVIPWKLTAQQTTTAGMTQLQEKPAEKVDLKPTLTLDRPASDHVYRAVIMTDSVKVRATADGLAKVLCKPGDHVQRGQVVVKLDTANEEAQLLRAQKTLQKDKQEFERKNRLFETRSVSESEMDEARLQLSIDEADIDVKNKLIEAGVIRAPLAGAVNDVAIHEHEYVAKGDLLMTVVATSAPVASCDVPAVALLKTRVGDTVLFQTILYPDPFVGQIEFIAPTADGRSQTIQIHCVIKDPDGKLRPGIAGMLSMKGTD